MTRLLMAIAIASTSWASSAYAQQPAIEIWHSDTFFAGQGMCSANFSIDAGWQDEAFDSLQIAFTATDPKGAKIASDTLEFDGPIGDSNATRYNSAFFESEAACGDDLRITIQSAIAMVNGKKVKVDVLPREFKPFKIVAP